MFEKIKKTLGRRKPLQNIPVPNGVAATPAAGALLDDKALMRSHLNSILADPDTLDLHYKEMLSSRGTSDFAKGQMGQLPESTKRELVRMWLMSRPETDPKEKTNVTSPIRKRAHSDTSADTTSEDDAKRQKTAKRNTFIDMTGKRSRSNSADDSQPASKYPKQQEEEQEQERPGTSSSRASQESSRSDVSVGTRGYIEEVKHMHYVVTHRDEYDPETTDGMGFEKMIIKLRLFLRAESIKKLRQFLDTGGLVYLVKTVNGILDVEWRKQHETKFLLGILHCIRIILKTEEGANRFFRLGQHDVLFPRLVRMQFSWGEERRAFFRFDHRAVITEIFYYWVRNVNRKDSSLEERANQMLQYLQDFADKEKQHHDIISVMHKQRRYKNWHKEVKDTTIPWRGTPWMYYHKENVIAPREQDRNNQIKMYSEEFAPTRRPELISSTVRSHTETLVAHYVAANLDLMNICIVAQSQQTRRILLRQEFADCGFEDLFSRKLRLASQVNFPCIESALRDWVTAAQADGWPTSHVTALPESSVRASFLEQTSSTDSPIPRLLNFDLVEDTPFDF